MIVDPIADMLTRLRNASMARISSVTMPYSKLKQEIARVMKENEYLTSIEVTEENGKKFLTLGMPEYQIHLKRVSKPGQRIYQQNVQLHPLKKRYGLKIITTSQGIMTAQEAKKKKVGGEILCEIY